MTKKIRRYAVFAGTNYYPLGGWDDFKDSFSLPEEARARVAEEQKPKGIMWAYAIDLETGETLKGE